MFANNGFKIRGWDETGLHVGSVRRFGGSMARSKTRSCPIKTESLGYVMTRVLQHPIPVYRQENSDVDA